MTLTKVPDRLVLHTPRLTLILESTEAVLARIDAMPAEHRAEVSPEWLARLRAAQEPGPWTHGFALVERAGGATVGSCAYTGPPDADGVVEIAYVVEPAYRGRGYAREAARALVDHALNAGGARRVRAHTRADNPASARVLRACDFTLLGEVVLPDDGPVLRWELRGPGPR